MSTTTIDQPNLLTRACDNCGQGYFYESIKLGDNELGHTVQPRCQDCQADEDAKIAAQNEADRRRRIQAEIEATLDIDVLETDPTFPTFKRDLWEVVSRWRPTREKMWLFIHGPADRSKTRCLALFYKKIMWTGVKCAWTTPGDIQDAARERNRFGKDHDITTSKESIRQWLRVPYLFIDDLGKNVWTREFEALFFDILNTRKNRRLPIIFSSNAHPETLGLLISDLNRDPIVGRLLDRTTILTIK